MEDRPKLGLPEGLWIARNVDAAETNGQVSVMIWNLSNYIIQLNRKTKLTSLKRELVNIQRVAWVLRKKKTLSRQTKIFKGCKNECS